MYPDLLGIFGVTLYGPIFERVLWILGSLLMIWGVFSSIDIFRKGRKSEAIIQGIIVLALLIWFGYQTVATFSPDYTTFFTHPLVMHSYAFMILVGIVCGTFTAMKMAPHRKFESTDLAKLCLWLVLFGFIGARAAHVIVDLPSYWDACFNPPTGVPGDCTRWLDVSEGGLTFYGGVIAGIIVMTVFYFKHKKTNPDMLSICDILAAALSIAHGFGRIGCLAAGCCWGAITTGSIGVRYGADSFAFAELSKDPSLQAEIMKSGQTPLMHATQLYEAFGEFALYGILWLLLVKKAQRGTMLATWLISYGVLRFIVEIMRDDTERGHYFETSFPAINEFFNVAPNHTTILSTSQGIALIMIGIGVVTLIIRHILNKKAVGNT